MTDITKCSGKGCPMKAMCYRVTAPSSGEEQSMIVGPPVTFTESQLPECNLFWLDSSERHIEENTNHFIQEWLTIKHPEGYQSGGSGHLSHVQIKLLSGEKTQLEKGLFIAFAYKLLIDSEFGGTEETFARLLILDNEMSIKDDSILYHHTEHFRDDLGFN